jgi:hypothetical protein
LAGHTAPAVNESTSDGFSFGAYSPVHPRSIARSTTPRGLCPDFCKLANLAMLKAFARSDIGFRIVLRYEHQSVHTSFGNHSGSASRAFVGSFTVPLRFWVSP